MKQNEYVCFNTLFQWQCKAMQIYGNDKVKGYFEYFQISLSEIYYVSFEKPFEVKIEIAMDLKDMTKRLYSNENAQNEWVKKKIDLMVIKIKNQLKPLLTILKRSKRTHKISIFFKSWTEEIPALTIFEK